VVAVLTPGIYNSAYFEHAFLADQMGANWSRRRSARGRWPRLHAHHAGWKAIDVLYRRVDDDFLDPLPQPHQHAGRGGHHGCLSRGRDHHRQCAGHSIADDKAIYSFMPEIVEFYTGEKPILKNVPPGAAPRRIRWPMCWITCRTGGEGGARQRRLWHADRADLARPRSPRLNEAARPARQLHRPAHALALHRADLHQGGAGAAPCRSAALRAGVARHQHHAGRADAWR
jgi:hypothetical protein